MKDQIEGVEQADPTTGHVPHPTPESRPAVEFVRYEKFRSLGSVSTVFRKVVNGRATGTADVPCGSCNACCRSGYDVELTPGEAERLPHVPDRYGDPVLPKHDDGSCALLVDGKYSVYDHRPQSCRTYDCRIYALTGCTPGSLADAGHVPFEATIKTKEDRVLAMAFSAAVTDIMAPGSTVVQQFAAEGLAKGLGPAVTEAFKRAADGRMDAELLAEMSLYIAPQYLSQANQALRYLDDNPEARAKFEGWLQTIQAQRAEPVTSAMAA